MYLHQFDKLKLVANSSLITCRYDGMSAGEAFAEGHHPVLTGRALISTTQNGTAAAWIPSPRSSVQSDGRLHALHLLTSASPEAENLSPGLKISAKIELYHRLCPHYVTVTLGTPQALHTKVPPSFPALIHAPRRKTDGPLQLQLLSLLGDR